MIGDETVVVDQFAAWLTADRWKVDREVDFIDIVAERDGQRLIAEANGSGAAPGVDLDIDYGQLLRWMPAEDDPAVQYAIVVRDEPHSVRDVLRVPEWVREMLRIALYAVADNGAVRQLESAIV